MQWGVFVVKGEQVMEFGLDDVGGGGSNVLVVCANFHTMEVSCFGFLYGSVDVRVVIFV